MARDLALRQAEAAEPAREEPPGMIANEEEG
jgi:hypothetical protein